MFSINTIKQRYDDLIEQNSTISANIAQNIEMASLGEETTEMVTHALLDVERACASKTFKDKVIEALPAVIGDRIQNSIDRIERLNMKHSNIAEVASKHFDALSNRRDKVKDNVMALIDIREKLEQSVSILTTLKEELTTGMEELKDVGTAEAKKELIICKEMNLQITSQLATQKDLIGQLDMVEFTADVVLDTLNQTLPDLKSNFIDQISITTALDNLKRFKDNVDKTRQMTISLQEQTHNNNKAIMLQIVNEGIGMRDSEIQRLEKLGNEKLKLGRDISEGMARNSKQMDNNLARLNVLIEKSSNPFSHMALENKAVHSQRTTATATKTQSNAIEGELIDG